MITLNNGEPKSSHKPRKVTPEFLDRIANAAATGEEEILEIVSEQKEQLRVAKKYHASFQFIDACVDIFTDLQTTFVPTRILLDRLNLTTTGRAIIQWREFNVTTLARTLSKFQISPKRKYIRPTSRRGYDLADFLEYLSDKQLTRISKASKSSPTMASMLSDFLDHWDNLDKLSQNQL